MPLQNTVVSLAVAGLFPVVPGGNTVNSVNVADAPGAGPYFLKLGNNPRIGPLNGPKSFLFSADGLTLDDLSEGVWIEVVVPTAAAALTVVASFARGRVSAPPGLIITAW